MKILIFGASGMVGQGVLRECFLDANVTAIVSVGRSSLNLRHEKLKEIIHSNFFEFDSIANDLKDCDVCFFSLGVSAVGMKEADYARITYDVTLAAARVLAKIHPNMVFIYVSGQGVDSSERGPLMWARVKGKTENALLQLPLKAYMFRPGLIQPLHGIKSKTLVYRIPYILLSPFISFLVSYFPKYVTTTERLGRAMLRLANKGSSQKILETMDINRWGI